MARDKRWQRERLRTRVGRLEFEATGDGGAAEGKFLSPGGPRLPMSAHATWDEIRQRASAFSKEWKGK
jgi:hypothetical protein